MVVEGCSRARRFECFLIVDPLSGPSSSPLGDVGSRHFAPVHPHFSVRHSRTPLSSLRFVVPLSEEEQRALAEIERTFYEDDPTFVRAVRGAGATAFGQPAVDRPAKGSRPNPAPLVVAARPLAPFFALAAVGAVLMTFGYSVHVVLGFFGVCILFAGLLLAAFELKRRVQSVIAQGGVPLSVRLAARVDAQRAMRERQAEQIRQAQMRRSRQQPPPSDNVDPQ